MKQQAEHLFQTLLHQAFEGEVGLEVGIGQDEEAEGDVRTSVTGSELAGFYV